MILAKIILLQKQYFCSDNYSNNISDKKSDKMELGNEIFKKVCCHQGGTSVEERKRKALIFTPETIELESSNSEKIIGTAILSNATYIPRHN